MSIENGSQKIVRLLGRVLDTMTEGLSLQQISTDSHGKLSQLQCIAVNHAFEQCTGLTAAEVLGKMNSEVFPDIDFVQLEHCINTPADRERSTFEAVLGPLGRPFQISAFKLDPNHLAVLYLDSTAPRRHNNLHQFHVELQEKIKHLLDTSAPDAQVNAKASPGNSSTDSPAKSSLTCAILLVEDHPDTRKVMTRLLTRMGCMVKPASTATEALAIAKADRFDLVISDIGLPDFSGLDLMQQLKDQYQLRGIALSGFGMDEDLVRSTEAGFEVHLTKPINLQTLEDTVRRMTRVVL